MANMKYIILLSSIMLLLLPNNSLQEDPNDLPADTPAVIEAKDKRSVDAILDPEDLRPINAAPPL